MAIDNISKQVQSQAPMPSGSVVASKQAPAALPLGDGKVDAASAEVAIPNALHAQAAQAPKQAQGQKELDEAVVRLREFASSQRRDMEISVDKDSGRFVVKVLDSKTKEVVRQIPSEDLLRVARQLDANDKGGLLEATA